MNIAILKMDEKVTLNERLITAFTEIGVVPIGISQNNGVDYLLTRIDDENMTGNTIIEKAPAIVADVDFITGRSKEQLIENYRMSSQVEIAVGI